ncbi:Flp family type IVb pilin [Variovorax sp. PAMC26660]|uniref:Flp family type IVb pilin n=1 Tax=Variovorax sp. PAMC26660 TaxID=2762322 RepID=UPI00164E11E8|nr:Flp family type IVb pilin [Variovorax sp. PAMC26660]QNK69444.1 Flp family type IVb pilin [Variovorax sp. PAMC26660]
MLGSITRFLRDEEGATAIEYGIIAGLMATILVAVFGTGASDGLGLILKGIFDAIGKKVTPATA